MTPPDTPASRTDASVRATRLRLAQRALDRLFRSMPLRGRARLGLFMAFKVGLSASVAFAIGHALHTEQAFWAAISAVAVTQTHFADTRGAGRDRFIGTIIGGAGGLLGLCVGESGSLPVFAAALTLVTLACWIANVGSAARIAGITTAMVSMKAVESHCALVAGTAKSRMSRGIALTMIVSLRITTNVDRTRMRSTRVVFTAGAAGTRG